MSPRLHLDVPSALKAGYSEAFSDFKWPVKQQTYDSVSQSFIDVIEDVLAEESLSDEARTNVALSLIPIVNECFYFAGSYINILACEQQAIEYTFAESDFFYPTIHKFRSAKSESIDESLSRIESRPVKRTVRNFLRSQRNSIRLIKLSLRSKLKPPRKYRITSNTLERESRTQYDVALTNIVSGSKRANDFIGDASPHGGLSNKIAIGFSKVLSSFGFDADDLAQEYFRRVSTFHLNIAESSRNKNYKKYLNTKNSFLVSGTAGGFQSRLVSWLFQHNNLPVVRFTHGGERGLMNDTRWHYPELMFADNYIVHGRTEAEQVRNAVAQKTTSLTSVTLKVYSVGSSHHRKLRSDATATPTSDSINEVMVLTNSFTSERRPAFASTGEDVVYLEWHLRLLSALRKTDFRVVTKRHPKGNLTQTPLFDGYVDEEVINLPFTGKLKTADAFVFDFAASAFMEALCTNKPVVLIEFPHRRLSAASRDDVASTCTVVQAGYDENNRITADFDAVIAGISKPVDIDSRQSFLDSYLLDSFDGLPSLFESSTQH